MDNSIGCCNCNRQSNSVLFFVLVFRRVGVQNRNIPCVLVLIFVGHVRPSLLASANDCGGCSSIPHELKLRSKKQNRHLNGGYSNCARMDKFSLDADGLLRLSQLRHQQTKDPIPFKTEVRLMKHESSPLPLWSATNHFNAVQNDLGGRVEAMDIEQNQAAEHRLSAKTVDVPANIPNEKASLQGRCVDFLDRFRIETLSEACTITLPDFVHLLSIELLDERNDKECDGMIRDLLVRNRAKFLACLQHLNWTWKSLLANEQLHTLFLKDIIPACGDPEEKVLMAQIALKMFSNAIQEESSSLADEFTLVLEELCRLPDFSAVFMWMLVALLACEVSINGASTFSRSLNNLSVCYRKQIHFFRVEFVRFRSTLTSWNRSRCTMQMPSIFRRLHSSDFIQIRAS